MSVELDFSDIPLSYLKQELFVAQKILAKASYYKQGEKVLGRLSEFYSKYFPVPSSLGEAYDTLGRVNEVLKKFNNLEFITNLEYGNRAMQSTTISFLINKDKLRLYKVLLIKEIRIREGGISENEDNEDILRNGKLSYDIDNQEVKYDENPTIGLTSSTDYGRFLILLMSKIDRRISYTDICDAIGRDYKIENADPEKDRSIRREIQLLKKDLLIKLKKTGIPKKELDNLIVSRNGYKMNTIS